MLMLMLKCLKRRKENGGIPAQRYPVFSTVYFVTLSSDKPFRLGRACLVRIQWRGAEASFLEFGWNILDMLVRRADEMISSDLIRLLPEVRSSYYTEQAMHRSLVSYYFAKYTGS